MKTYKVTVAVDLPTYAVFQIKARSLGEAERKVADDIAENGWDSKYWMDVDGFEPEWSEADNLRVVECACP